MRDEIDVSSGSVTSVETDDLFRAVAALAALAADASGWSHEAAIARCITQWSADASGFGFAEQDLDRAAAILQEVVVLADDLAVLLDRAATRYAEGEQRSADVSSLLAALGAFAAGGFARNVLLGALPLAPTAIASLLVAQHPEAGRLAAVLGQPLLEALAQHSDLLDSAAFVRLVRAAVSSADDFALGLAGVDPPLAYLLGDQGAGVVGPGGMAGVLLILAGKNAYTATPILLSRTSTAAVTAPSSLADAAARIPAPGTGRSQIRIERYTATGGEPAYAVYLGGTSDFSTGGNDPFDMGSNLAGIAGSDAAAYRATLDAMDDAGIQPGDRVRLFGYSQGGLVAARIAESGAYDTETLVTFGAPTGQIAIPDRVAHVAVEHAEDIIPALGGDPLGGEAGRQRVVVSRELYDEAGPPPGSGIGSAHHLVRYIETAALIDDSTDPRLDPLKETLSGIDAGDGSAIDYRAERDRR